MHTPRSLRNLLIAALLAIGCADSTLRPHDAGSPEPATPNDASAPARDAAADAGTRVKPRTVMVHLPPIASRTVREGPDGRPAYGEITPLDGAKACIVQRREAYAAFEPFEKLDEPVCALSKGGQVVRIPGAPANSDLVISVQHEGLRPLALTDRTLDDDATVVWEPAFSLMMLEQGASEAWLDPATPGEKGHGTLSVGATSYWTGPGQAAPELIHVRDLFFGIASGYARARGVNLKVTPAGGGDPIMLPDATRDRRLSLPPGSARLEFSTDNAHFSCGPALNYFSLSAGDNVFEVPIVPGHDHYAAPLCRCGSTSNTDVLIDFESCRFASDVAGGDDAGVP